MHKKHILKSNENKILSQYLKKISLFSTIYNYDKKFQFGSFVGLTFFATGVYTIETFHCDDKNSKKNFNFGKKYEENKRNYDKKFEEKIKKEHKNREIQDKLDKEKE